MERFTISKSEKQTIYEIYRACRICGAGGGYRMPIIQNIVDLETSDVELRQKIQDCLQLEVRSDDRMPPLICELCVDKVNDFYEFLELSRQTNKRTRSRLGLPLQTARKGESDSGDCILGVTEPLCADEPAPKKSKAGPKCSKDVKKETEKVNVKVEPAAPSPATSRSSSVSSRSSRTARRPPTPPRPVRVAPKTETPKTTPVTQEKKRIKEKEKEKEPEKGTETKGSRHIVSRKELQDLMQDSQKYDDNSLLLPRSMKRKEVEPPKPAIIPKRTRITPKEPMKEPVKEPEPAPAPPPRRKPGPKSRQAPPAEDPKVPVPLKIPKSKSKVTVPPPKVEEPPPKISPICPVCGAHLKTNAALTNHIKSHTPTYTKQQHACNPCGKWFETTEETASHHRYHRAATFPYHCRRCFEDYSTLQDYESHINNGLCVPYDLIPDVKCEKCWKTFITQTLLSSHKCQGYEGRPGGNCSRCARPYVTQKTLKAHQKICTYKKKQGGLTADPDVLRRLKPMQVRLSRCDDLLARRPGGRCDAAAVEPNHGLDKNYLYPYIRFKPVKPKPLRYRGTVAIREAIKDEPERDRYTHWDSEDSDSDSVIKSADSLTTLCLKKLFSKNILGKVPRKKRRIKNEAFDSIDDFSIGSDINDIISSLNDDLRNDCVLKTRKDSLISIAINDIIGVPNSFVPSLSLENENVARSSNDVHIDDKNESLNENDKSKDLNDVEIENEGTDTVVGASDISTDLNLKATEEQENILNEAASERMDDDMGTNDSETRNDLESTNKDENIESNNDEIRNFKIVDGQSNDNNFKYCNETVIQSNNLSPKNDYENAELNNSNINIDNFENQNEPGTVDANNDVENQNPEAISFNDSEMSNDNLDFKNNCENIDMKNELESQNENPDYDLENHNDNLGTGNSYDNPAIDNSKTKLNSDTDIQNYNSNINQANLKNIDGNDDMNNDIETRNENLEAVNLSSETNTQNDNISSDHLENENNDNIEISRIGNETEVSQGSEEILEEPNLLNLTENELQNSAVNGIHENNEKTNYTEESDKSEETKKTTKESPIKHSIDNLIGDTVYKNPDKYIDEVISSIEDIINKNPRNEEITDDFINGENSSQMGDQMLMDALDAQIGDSKDKMDNEKITLDDLLPKNNRSVELDDISDDDFDFDA